MTPPSPPPRERIRAGPGPATVDQIWHAVLARPAAERHAAAAALCAGDAGVKREIESLLRHLEQASAAGFGTPGSALEVAHESLVGCRLGPYAVQALLGVGGMGEVYRAHDETLDRTVALKILPDLWIGDPDRRARLDQEARVLASLNHPNRGHLRRARSALPAGERPAAESAGARARRR